MRKSWLKWSVLVVLIVLSVVNIYRLYDVFHIFGRFGSDNVAVIKTAYYQMYDELNGVVSDEEIQFLKENDIRLSELAMNQKYSTEYNSECYTGYEFSDFALFHFHLVPEVEYYLTYSNLSNEIVNKAYDNVQFYKKFGNKYECKYNTLITNLYSERYISEYKLTEWVEYYFGYDFSSLLIIVMLILGVCSCFTQEKESRMTTTIISNGKTAITVNAKLISSLVYSLLLTVYFVLLDFATVCSIYGIDGLNMPLYSAEYFAYSPYGFSFVEAILLSGLLKFIALFVIAELILIISELSPNTIVAGILSFVAVVILVLSAGYFDTPINPITALTPDTYLKELNCINLFGEPVPALYIALVSMVVLCIALWTVIVAVAPNILRRNRC